MIGGMSGGLGMMLKSMGFDPVKVQAEAEKVIVEVAAVRHEMDRQGALLNAIARKLDIEVPPSLENVEK